MFNDVIVLLTILVRTFSGYAQTSGIETND